MKWIKTKDKLPKIGDVCLWVDSDGDYCIDYITGDENDKCCPSTHWAHWMNVPKPPKK